MLDAGCQDHRGRPVSATSRDLSLLLRRRGSRGGRGTFGRARGVRGAILTRAAVVARATVVARRAVVPRGAVPGVALLARLDRLRLDRFHLLLVEMIGLSDHHAQEPLVELYVTLDRGGGFPGGGGESDEGRAPPLPLYPLGGLAV